MLRFMAFLSLSIWGLSRAEGVLVPLILAAMLAFVLAPGIRFLKMHGIPEALALIGAALLFLAPMAAIVYEAVVQGEALSRGLPALVAQLRDDVTRMTASSWGVRLHLKSWLNPSSLSDKLGQGLGSSISMAVSGVRAFLTAGGELLLVLAFSLLMLASRERLKRSAEVILRRGSPSVITEHPGDFVDSIARLIQRFLVVRVGISIVVGGIDFLILATFGLPYALFAGAFLGFMTIVPMVGFILGLIPPLIIAVTSHFSLLRIVAIVVSLSLVSAVESHVFSPKLLGRHLNLNLLFTFLGLFVGEHLWGGWGMFLSIPILGIARIVLAATPVGLPWSQLLAQKEAPGKPKRSAERGAKAA